MIVYSEYFMKYQRMYQIHSLTVCQGYKMGSEAALDFPYFFVNCYPIFNQGLLLNVLMLVIKLNAEDQEFISDKF